MTELARTRAFETWLANANGAGLPQRPEEELLAEHHIMLAVLGAMDAEGKELLHGKPLRPDFWKGVVEFIGNFSHRIHRVKEERFFFPALEAWGLIEPEDCQRLEEDHRALRDLTFLLCDGVNEGDWEKAFRVVAMYLGRVRLHLEAEEAGLLSVDLSEIGDERIAPMLESFAALERAEFIGTSRLHYVEIADSLCRDVGLMPPSAEEATP